MSEDDRAAKAARARALLAQKKKKKAAESTSGGVARSASPALSPPESRVLSPATYEPMQTESQRESSDLFPKIDPSDTSWLQSGTPLSTQTLPSATIPAISPPPSQRVSSPPTVRTSISSSPISNDADKKLVEQLRAQVKTLKNENSLLKETSKRTEDLESQVRNLQDSLSHQQSQCKELEDHIRKVEREKEDALRTEQQTISLLVSEKAALTEELEGLQAFQSKAEVAERSLQEERERLTALHSNLQRLEGDLQRSSTLVGSLQSTEKELSEKTRDQERSLQLVNGEAANLRKDTEKHLRRIRELEEHIQSDDRAERLEASLKNTQDRADELEFQLSKLKQSYSTLKTERDDLDAELRKQRSTVAELRSKHDELSQSHSSTQTELQSILSAKATLSDENATLQTEVDAAQKAIALLQEKLNSAASELVSNSRQLQTMQADLAAANRRAEESEKNQRDLQSEGTTLMRSLEEMRPKIVELTSIKLEFTERVETLERQVSSRESAIAQLESELELARAAKEQVDEEHRDTLSKHQKEQLQSQSASDSLQDAHSNLQDELESALASVKALEAERVANIQVASRRLAEIELLASASLDQSNELEQLRAELDQQRIDQAEGQELLVRVQNELEAIAEESNAKDEEIARLREALDSRPNGSSREVPRSLDDEMLSSFKQQHALELSNAKSQIRSLETSLFDAEARSHALQKHIASLEDQLASPVPSRPSSRGAPLAPELRRSSGSGHRASNLATAPIISAFDQELTPETRHKRKVSLSMLKARIDSETAAVAATSSRPASRALTSVDEIMSDKSSPRDLHHPHVRPQFLDDSHVFWCSSCRGDLVTL